MLENLAPKPLDPPLTKAADSALKVFASTFLTVFLAELGDKTQVTTLLMSAQSQNPGVVFLGAALALVLTSLLGVLLGQFIGSRLSPVLLQRAAGVSLVGIALSLAWELIHVG